MENLRVRLTKQMIHTGLLELLEEKNIEKISVTELCQKATVNRTTFYKYYGSQFDVLNEIINDLFQEIRKIGENYKVSRLFQREILQYLQENKKLCVTLIDRVPFEMFSAKLMDIEYLDQKTKDSFSDQYSDRQKDYLLRYYQNGCFGLMSCWLHDQLPLSIDELQDVVDKLSRNIMFR